MLSICEEKAATNCRAASVSIDARRNRTGNGGRKLSEGRTGHVFR